jgi:hypothetical protein
MRIETAAKAAVAGIVAVSGGVTAQVVSSDEAGAWVCNGGWDCYEWSGNGCWDNYSNPPPGTDNGYIEEVNVPTIGWVGLYYCYKVRTVATSTAWDQPIDGGIMMTRTYFNNPVMRSDTHSLATSALTAKKWTKQLDDAGFCGKGYGWSGTSWWGTSCF